MWQQREKVQVWAPLSHILCTNSWAQKPHTHSQVVFFFSKRTKPHLQRPRCQTAPQRHRWQPQEWQHDTEHVWDSSGEAQAPTGDLNKANTQRHAWETLILPYLSLIPWERLRVGKSLGWYLLIYLFKRVILDKHKQGADLKLHCCFQMSLWDKSHRFNTRQRKLLKQTILVVRQHKIALFKQLEFHWISHSKCVCLNSIPHQIHTSVWSWLRAGPGHKHPALDLSYISATQRMFPAGQNRLFIGHNKEALNALKYQANSSVSAI